MITANNYRELLRIVKEPSAAKHLVEETVRDDVLKLLNVAKGSNFSLETEFKNQYTLIKTAVQQLGGQIQSKEDLDLMREAQKYLMFLLKQEEKLTNIRAVQEFKEKVLSALDKADPKLREEVINEL
jgi:hypothetical protein